MNRPSTALLASLLLLSLGTACRKPKPPPATASVVAAPPADAAVSARRRDSGAGLLVAEIAGRRSAIIADEDDEAVRIVDLATRTVISTTRLGGMPGQMLLGGDGTLYVAVRGAARVVALRLSPDGAAREVARHETSEEPYGLALTPDGKNLLVSSIATPRLEMLRASDLEPLFATTLPRDPRSIVVARDGTRAFVSHATGSLISVVALGPDTPGRAHTVALGMREKRRDFGVTIVSKPVMPEPGKSQRRSSAPVAQVTMARTASQGFAISRIDDRLVLPQSLVMTSDGERISTGYGSIEASTLGTHVPFVAQIDEDKETLQSAALGGPTDRACFERKTECIVPRAVIDDGARIFVACLDSDEVLVVDPKKDAEHAPECKKTLEERPRLHVDSPTAVALTVDGDVVAWSSFTHRITLLGKPDALPGAGVGSTFEVPRDRAVAAEVAQGQRLFHQSGNPKISADGRACASCHVDGRDDGLVWPTPAGERQTPMLAGRLAGTGPYGWNGEHATLSVHIASTLRNLHGSGLAPQEIDALAAYCLSMHAPKSTTTTELARRGKEVFHSADTSCSSCHEDERRFTDGETHVLSKGAAAAFDTPSLAFVGETAPYFHDGRFATLEALVDGAEGPHLSMGRTKQLSAEDRRALVAYLQTL